MENQGWIKLHRKLNDTAFKNKPLIIALFVDLLTNANHLSKTIIWNNKEMKIEAGQLVTGLHVLSNRTGISIQSIRTGLVTLKSTNTITIKSTTKFSVITILNWDKYQILTNDLTNKQQTTNKQATTNNNDKNVENEKNSIVNNTSGIIHLFSKVNPSYKQLFGNKTQRASMDRLIAKYGEAAMKRLLIRLPEIINKPYAPRITTPYELEAKMGQLLTHLQQEKGKNKGEGVLRL